MASSRLLTPRLSTPTRLRPVSLARSQIRTKATAPFRLPGPRNEPNPLYTQGSPERLKLKAALADLRSQLPVQSHIFYNGKTQQASKSWNESLPAENATIFTNYPVASKEQINTAIDSALKAKKDWDNTTFVDRAAIFLKAAELVTGKYRYELIAATMLGQGKNIWQAEIDAAAELADFFLLNCNFAAELYERQPTRGTDGMWRYVSQPITLYNYYAGLPADVVQFVAGDAEEITSEVLAHRDFAGLNFIGSSDVFRSIYAKIGEGIGKKTYREFPRVVGETSGKNFHLVHNTADIPSAVNHTIRGAFEYQGQKCSATSRAYIPASKAEEFISLLKAGVQEITIGNPDGDLEAFMGPVIHRRSFDKIKSIIDASNKDPSLKVIAGGTYDDSVGFYVHPTVYQTDSPDHRLFNEEIFGPVLAIHVYSDEDWSQLLTKVDQAGGGFALTGAVFAKDRKVIREAEDALRYSAGNFYINCKTTAALIGQQSFGGARASGTNDKAGSSDVLRRFTSPRMIKEEFFPLDGFKYPSNH
ncbi:Aldehyde/histidinol dehydrogenase [Aspergillus crustosus]